MRKKIRILFYTIVGECIKCLVRLRIIRPTHGCNTAPRPRRIIASLTSYGRRVAQTDLAITSLMRQTVPPDMIILWLDDTNWNAGNIPDRLKRLQPRGLTVRFCPDLRSYKKLVPALDAFPDDYIITFDDDLYYDSRIIERLMNAVAADPDKIYTNLSHAPTLTPSGSLAPYNQWCAQVATPGVLRLFPNGGSGVIYQRRLLHPDVTDAALFQRLSPLADDVWFYFMEILRHTEVENVGTGHHNCIPMDNLYQLTHRGARLADSNCQLSQNDLQIQAVMRHYSLTASDLKL